jgi:hypothetical protein
MAITTALCSSFKQEILVATHDLTNSSGDTIKAALFTSSATLGAATTAYAVTNEISGAGYSAGGNTLTNVTPVLSSTTALCDFNDTSWAAATFTANGMLIYNSSKSDKALSVHAFGGDKSVTGGTFTVQFPAADASNAIIRIA